MISIELNGAVQADCVKVSDEGWSMKIAPNEVMMLDERRASRLLKLEVRGRKVFRVVRDTELIEAETEKN